MIRHRLTVVAAALAVVVAIAGLAASSADAYTASNRGWTGRVGVPRVYGAVIDDQAPMTAALQDIFNVGLFSRVGGKDSMWLYSPQRFVGRSLATSGRQIATVQYRVWFRTWCTDYSVAMHSCVPNRWQFDPHGSTTAHVAIPAGSSGITLNAWKGPLTPNWPDAANVGFDVVVTWWTPTGRFLGRKTIDYSSPGDFGCLTTQTVCETTNPPGLGASLYIRYL